MVTYKVIITESGIETLSAIRDQRVQKILNNRIGGLANNPEQQGVPLKDDMLGYRALHVLKNRYRIIFRVDDEIVTVFVVAAGIRKSGDKSDIYEALKRYTRLGLIEAPKKKPAKTRKK